jgi:hypothetical protein
MADPMMRSFRGWSMVGRLWQRLHGGSRRLPAGPGVEPSGQEFRASLMAAGEPREGGMDRAVQMFSVRFS